MSTLDDVIASARSEATPEPDSKARVRQRLEAALLQAPAPAAVPARPLLRRWAGRAFWTGVGLCAGILGSHLYALRGSERSEVGALAPAQGTQTAQAEASVLAERPAGGVPSAFESSRGAEGALPSGTEATPPPVATAAVPSGARPFARKATAQAAPAHSVEAVASSALQASAAVANPDHMRQVLAALRRAQAALRAGHAGTALEEMDVLDRRVPSSVLEEERTLTRVLAWCDAERLDRAGQLARRLLDEHPDSVYAPRLRESCVGRERLLEEMRTHASKVEPGGD